MSERGTRNVTINLSSPTNVPQFTRPSGPLPPPPPRHTFPTTSRTSPRYGGTTVVGQRIAATEQRPLSFKNTRELSPVEEDQEDKNILSKLDGLIGMDQVVRGAHFAVHSCITYPFTVLRRQCQVFPYYSLTSSSLMPWHTLSVMHGITFTQGIYSWWRGWQAQSVYLIGRPVVGAIVSRLVEPFRNRRVSRKRLWFKRKLIRFVVDGLTYTVCMPVLSFIFMESVQHTIQRTYSSDYGGFREFLLERPLIYPDASNRLSYLQLLIPTLATNILNDLLLAGVTSLLTRYTSRHHSVSIPHQISSKLWTSFLSSFLVDLLLYPLLTVTIRLHCQGLPVLVENVETGSGVQYVTTFYSGPLDCVTGVLEAEGTFGFYKGLSALLLQYTVQAVLLVVLWRGVAYWEGWRSGQSQDHPHSN